MASVTLVLETPKCRESLVAEEKNGEEISHGQTLRLQNMLTLNRQGVEVVCVLQARIKQTKSSARCTRLHLHGAISTYSRPSHETNEVSTPGVSRKHREEAEGVCRSLGRLPLVSFSAICVNGVRADLPAEEVREIAGCGGHR